MNGVEYAMLGVGLRSEWLHRSLESTEKKDRKRREAMRSDGKSEDGLVSCMVSCMVGE